MSPVTVRRAVRRFVLSLLAVVVLVGAIGLWLLHRSATKEALEDARVETTVVGRAVVAPELTPGLFDGSTATRARLEQLVERQGEGA
jgi:hypothetical protein